MRQEEFNQLMRGYYRQFGKKRICTHNPQVILMYRLSVLFSLGVIAGFIITHF